MAGFETLRLDGDGPIAHLVLNRPAQLNAINRQMLQDLSSACETIEGDPSIKVVTLRGEGRAFCAGADLRTVQEISPDPKKWEAFTRLWHRVFNRIEALPVPVIAGDGLELEIRAVAEHMKSADAREGLSAFVEKRKPKFS